MSSEDVKVCTKFRKKPIVIEAVEFDGTAKGVRTVEAFAGRTFGYTLRGGEDGRCYIHIPTLEGGHDASPGDWIIRGVKGEFYPCKPDIFAATYESVEPSAPQGKDEKIAAGLREVLQSLTDRVAAYFTHEGNCGTHQALEDAEQAALSALAAYDAGQELPGAEREKLKAELAEAQRMVRVAENAFALQDAISISGRTGELNALQIAKAWLALEKRAEAAEAALAAIRELRKETVVALTKSERNKMQVTLASGWPLSIDESRALMDELEKLEEQLAAAEANAADYFAKGTTWQDKALAAEAELARLRAVLTGKDSE